MNQSASSFLVRTACALALGLAVIAIPEIAVAQISVSITLAPPALPVYEQPVLAEEGGIWTPGYWDYDEGNYFWVPGTWVQPPAVGLLWTPGYWGWGNGGYAFNAGYWGTSVGFYGGINYGFGYFGQGYEGGHWQGDHFYYNTAVSHVNVTNIHNTYTQTVVNNMTINRVSFNGGKGGITARPTSAEQAAARAPHQAATAVQVQHRQAAMSDRTFSASVNHGKPPVAATARPNATAASTERAPGKTAAAPAESRPPVHAADIPAIAHKPAPSTGQPERDKVNQRQQDELSDNQEKQRQNLQKQQADDHAQAAKQPTASAKGHASEQKSLSETQQKNPEPKRDPTHGEKQP